MCLSVNILIDKNIVEKIEVVLFGSMLEKAPKHQLLFLHDGKVQFHLQLSKLFISKLGENFYS